MTLKTAARRLLGAFCLGMAMAATQAVAYSAAPASLTGRTLKDGGIGCVGCHIADSGLSVVVTGPATLPVRSNGTFTLTATKASAGAGVKLGMAAAASDGVIGPLGSYLTRVDPPGEVIHSAAGGSGGTLATTNASGVATYTFYYRTADDAVAGSTHTIYALGRLGGAHGWKHATSITVTATANVPPAPSIGTAVAGNAQASVAFTAPATNGGATITGYTVTASPGGATFTGMASPILATGLANGTSYTFSVHANNSAGAGLESGTSNAVVPGAPPGPPQAVSAVAGNAQATVSFSPPASSGTGSVTSYTVTASPGGASAMGSASPIVVSGLNNGTGYTFTVTASSGYGTGPASAPSSGVTPQPFPGAPSNLVATAGNGQVTLNFAPANDGGSPITSYAVSVTPNAGVDSGAGTTALTRTITGLSNGITYAFAIAAINSFGSGPPSTTTYSTPYGAPGAPTSVVAMTGNASASVSFVAAPNNGATVTGYTVVSNPAGGVDSNAGSPALTHTMNNLTNGVSYTFTVTATNAAGTGPASALSVAVIPGAVNAPRVVWTQLLQRSTALDTNCSTPLARRGPAMDATGNVFVNGCSINEAGAYDVVSHKLAAATGSTLWTATHTNFPVAGSYPLGHYLATGASGDVVLVSYTRDPATFNDAARLVKYSGSNGQILWTANDPSASIDETVISVASDAAGNVFMTSDGGNGLHTVKISNVNGAKLWHQNTNTYAASNAVDAAGNVAIAGSVLQNTRDFRVAKYNGSTGSVIWETAYSATPTGSYDQARVTVTDASGNVIVAGLSNGGAAVVKFDAATGAQLWVAPVATVDWSALAVDGAGDVFVTGSINGPVGSYNIITKKYSGANGTELWSATYNGAGNSYDFGIAIAVDQQGNPVVVGSSTDTANNDNVRAIKYSGSDGKSVWSHAYLSSFLDEGQMVAIGPDNAAVIVGVIKLGTGVEGLLVQKLADVTPPGAPQNLMATAKPGAIELTFSPPADDGGALISSYTATCGAASASAAASPILVSGLTPGMNYNCQVKAANYAGSGPAAGGVSATPLAALKLLRAASRKVHAAEGSFDLPLVLNVPVSGALAIEPRSAGSGHQVVFTFDGAVANPGNAAMTDAGGMPIGSASTTANGNDVIVSLSGLPNAARVMVNLTSVNGSINASVGVGFLIGDVNGSRTVDGIDVSATRGQSGRRVTLDNFRHDINLTGLIGAADVAVVKSRTGQSLP